MERTAPWSLPRLTADGSGQCLGHGMLLCLRPGACEVRGSWIECTSSTSRAPWPRVSFSFVFFLTSKWPSTFLDRDPVPTMKLAVTRHMSAGAAREMRPPSLAHGSSMEHTCPNNLHWSISFAASNRSWRFRLFPQLTISLRPNGFFPLVLACI